jgi:hypothetical protein
MRFALLSLVTVAALAVSAGSVEAQFRTHGGFAHPMMMNVNPGFNTSPFMRNSLFVQPNFNTFNTAPFVHPHHFHHHAVLFPTSSFAVPFRGTVSMFPTTSVFPTTTFPFPTTGGFVVPAQTPFVLPSPSSNFWFWSEGGSLLSPWWW